MARFKLAEIERPADDPFEVEGTDGTVYTLPHPQSLHYDELMQLQAAQANPNGANLPRMMELLLSGQHDAFVSDPGMDGFALEAVLNGWSEHYGLASAGEAGASSRSSSGTARRSKQTSPRGTTSR